MKCNPGNCFKCIREGSKYDFAYECSFDVLYQMDDEERWELAQEVFETCKSELDIHGPRLLQHNAEVLGDCISCLFMFGCGKRREGKERRPRYINSDQINQVLPIVRRSTKKSMQAIGVLGVVRLARYPFPKCWSRMNNEYDGSRTRS